MTPRAQLAVQRSGQLAWLRRAAGELWTLVPEAGAPDGWRASRGEAAPGSWLCAEADGQPRLCAGPAGEGGSGAAASPGAAAGFAGSAGSGGSARALLPLLSLLRHPRSGALFAGTAETLEELGGRVHPIGAAAMVLSTDLRRLYAISPRGELHVLAAAAGAPAGDLPEAPELVLGGLDRFGAPAALAFGPAGLVLATAGAVVGINLRSRTVAPILAALPAALAALPAGAGLIAPAVAIDHRRTLYLADEHRVVALGSDGSPPRLIARLPA